MAFGWFRELLDCELKTLVRSDHAAESGETLKHKEWLLLAPKVYH